MDTFSYQRLVARNGHYEIRLTEELSEVAYIDQVKLLAVDHPTGQSIWLNEKFNRPHIGLEVLRDRASDQPGTEAGPGSASLRNRSSS
jgi:hypothetical protein